MEDAHFRPARADCLRHDRLRAPKREGMPDADDEFCFGWNCAIHSLEPRCFQYRSRPTMRPRPPVPTMKGRESGRANQQITTSPTETMAPTGVPGTVIVPKEDRGRFWPGSGVFLERGS